MEDQDLLRYGRHILLNEFGVEVQERLLRSHVLVVGAGGLGSAALLYLASAGVGRLTVADGDKVELSNLQRQVIHRESSIGENKALSAAFAIQGLNGQTKVHALPVRLEGRQLTEQVAAADLVVDCTDNFATRHAVNRACVELRRPLVSGAAIRFDGQIASFDLTDPLSPCYHCLFPDAQTDDDERCAVMGVFAPLVGVIGAMQASEAIRLLGGIGLPLVGRMGLFDALRGEWQTVRFAKDPACSVCGSGQVVALRSQHACA